MLLNPYRYVTAGGGGSNISFIVTADAGANTVSLPVGWAAGDLAIVMAGRSNSLTPPSLPAGWTNLGTAGSTGTTRSSRIGYRVLQSGDTGIGTWSNAVRVIVLIYRGQHATTPVDAANVGSVTGNSDTVEIPTVGMAVGDGTSWVAGLAQCPNATNMHTAAPTGMTNRGGTHTRIGGMDTNAGVASWSSATYVVNNTDGWQGWAVEIRSS